MVSSYKYEYIYSPLNKRKCQLKVDRSKTTKTGNETVNNVRLLVAFSFHSIFSLVSTLFFLQRFLPLFMSFSE